jgi:hypothetical protein
MNLCSQCYSPVNCSSFSVLNCFARVPHTGVDPQFVSVPEVVTFLHSFLPSFLLCVLSSPFTNQKVVSAMNLCHENFTDGGISRHLLGAW